MIDVLDLAGPNQRIQDAIDALRAGRTVLCPDDVRSRQLSERVEMALSPFGYELVQLMPHHDWGHAADALNVDSVSDPSRLLQNPRLNRHVLQIHCGEERWREWGRAMLQRLSNGNWGDSIKLWLIWPPALSRPTVRSVHTLEWQGCLNSADVRIYAADRFRERQGPGPTSYWEVLAAELAGPDLDLIDRLANLSQTLLDPIAWLCSEEAGTPAPSMPFDGKPSFESSVALARRCRQDLAARDLLNHRIWSAQVRTIFVGLESERVALLRPWKQSLETSYARKPAREDEELKEIPRDVEWGPAYARLNRDPRVPATTIALLNTARQARNCLAHGEPIESELLGNLLTCAAAAMRGRW